MAQGGKDGIKRGADERTHQHQDDLEPWAIARLSRVFAIDRAVLTRKITEAKLQPVKKTDWGTYFYPRDIVALLMGEAGKRQAEAKRQTAEVRLKEAKAKHAELKLKEFQRELVPSDEVVRALSDLMVAVRRKVLSVPVRVAPRLLKAKTPEAAMALLKTEMSLALEDLSKADPSTMLTQGEVAEDDEDEPDA